MTIDLTGAVPRVTATCDCCSREGELFRLIDTSEFLCEECFAMLYGVAA